MTTGTSSNALADAAATADRSLARLEAVLGHRRRRPAPRPPQRRRLPARLPHQPQHAGLAGRHGAPAPGPELGFFFREEIGHDAVGYPPPTAELARRRVASTRRTLATCLPATDPAVLERTVEIPDLGTMTVAAWVPLIVGHLTGHVDQAFEVLADRGALPEGPRVRAAVLTGLHEVRVEDRPDPAARPGWVVVRVESASLCGTDAHQYEGRIDTPFPRVPGHDFAGRVDSVGEGVEASLVGAPVAVKPSLPCGSAPTAQLGGWPTARASG